MMVVVSGGVVVVVGKMKQKNIKCIKKENLIKILLI